jgi:EAL domain-containing protein (putative c-di-GMP-specific phosphodiesterase class I)
MDILAAEGCTQAQGFLVSHAVPATDVGELLRTYNRERGGARAAG